MLIQLGDLQLHNRNLQDEIFTWQIEILSGKEWEHTTHTNSDMFT